ncbi:amino acid racemase [Sphingomonas ginkgonis]|uniref:Amino acid racemase n=1 Tax=Sphingomonas ginkgonis TaxID=2315330 RepID=A0A3R9YM07_9SPHN|nr:amino acid racemase [Sphingomonas ginkgonis]RST30791.1 amino acid racemase [Sphingomonas ginkgonis]
MKKLGIIGGISWASTAMYYEQINRAVTQRLGGLHSASIVMESFDLATVAALQQREDWVAMDQQFGSAARRLKDAGAEGLIICSNTGHRAYDAVSEAAAIPVLHIADATAERIARDGVQRAALLGTRFTMSQGFVRERLEQRGVQLAQLDPAWMAEIDRIIYEELAAGRVVRDSQRKLKTLITELQKKKVQAVILGCTELVLAVDTRANVLPVYDTTAIHAKAAAEWMLADEEEARAAA